MARNWASWKIVAPLLVLLVVVSFSWFHTRRTELPRIVVVLPSAVNPYWLEVRAGAEEAAASLSSQYDVRVEASQSMDAASQTSLLNGFLTRGNVAALVLGPASDTDTVPAVAKYSNAGIPVILIDTELNPSAVKASGVTISAFIGSDNLDGGFKAGETLLKALQGKGQKPRVLLLEGLPVHQSAIDRANGFMKAVGDHFDVVRVNGEWSRDKAQEIVASRFTRERFAGIFASNDEMALGAIAALESLHVDQTRWPVIVGFDATPDGLEAIKNGRMFATIKQSGKDLGKLGVLDAVAAARKSPTIQSRQLLPLSVVSR